MKYWKSIVFAFLLVAASACTQQQIDALKAVGIPINAEQEAFLLSLPNEPPAPVDGDCESWRPLFDKYDLPFDLFRPMMWRESNCTNAHTYNQRTRDDSWGVLQVNTWHMRQAWADAGFPVSYISTPEGGVAAVAFLYSHCGLGPWTKPYSCSGGWPL